MPHLSVTGTSIETSTFHCAATAKPGLAFAIKQFQTEEQAWLQFMPRQQISSHSLHSYCTLSSHVFGKSHLESLRGDEPTTFHLAGGKAAALEGLGSGMLQPFHVNRFEPGHSATNISHWVNSQQVYNVGYNVVRLCMTCTGTTCRWV